MEFNDQKKFILSIFQDKGICENGVAQLQFAEQIQAVIDYFKANHVFSLRKGLISTEKLQEIGLTNEFAARDCYFGKNGDLKANSNAVFIDCTIRKLTIAKNIDFAYFKNCTIENIYITGAAIKNIQLYDCVTVKNFNLIGSASVGTLRLTNSTIKILRIDDGACIDNVRRATKTINEVIGADRIKNILAV